LIDKKRTIISQAYLHRGSDLLFSEKTIIGVGKIKSITENGSGLRSRSFFKNIEIFNISSIAISVVFMKNVITYLYKGE
jgi:hypothetical protein